MLAVSMFWMAHRFDLAVDFNTLAWTRIFQSSGLALLGWEMRSYHMAQLQTGLVFFDRGVPDVIGYPWIRVPSARLGGI
jgi:predicted ATPase